MVANLYHDTGGFVTQREGRCKGFIHNETRTEYEAVRMTKGCATDLDKNFRVVRFWNIDLVDVSFLITRVIPGDGCQ